MTRSQTSRLPRRREHRPGDRARRLPGPHLFHGDNAPGDTNGQAITAFGAAWFAVSPAGKQVSGKGSTSNSSNGY
jgi:hypothetical protein